MSTLRPFIHKKVDDLSCIRPSTFGFLSKIFIFSYCTATSALTKPLPYISALPNGVAV